MVLASALLASSPAQAARQATLDNGVLHATVQLPNPRIGFYRGTRFDWSAVIASLTYAGHDFYGPWFTRTDPTVHDFIFSGNDIVAGPCSAITGPVEEFVSPDGALGYDRAAPGGTFVKIGVGVLEKPSRAKYDNFRLYRIVDGGRWTVRATAHSIVFRQQLMDPRSGYGYLYEKTLRLLPGKPEMLIEHSLHNTGRRVIDTSVYDHNFLVLDHRTTGPNFVITLPFTIRTTRPGPATLGEIEGRHIRYLRPLQGNDVFAMPIEGFGPTANDYNIQIENQHAGVGMRVTADQPLAQESLWSIRSTIGVEPFIHMAIAPGATFRWSYHYVYYSIPR